MGNKFWRGRLGVEIRLGYGTYNSFFRKKRSFSGRARAGVTTFSVTCCIQKYQLPSVPLLVTSDGASNSSNIGAAMSINGPTSVTWTLAASCMSFRWAATCLNASRRSPSGSSWDYLALSAPCAVIPHMKRALSCVCFSAHRCFLFFLLKINLWPWHCGALSPGPSTAWCTKYVIMFAAHLCCRLKFDGRTSAYLNESLLEASQCGRRSAKRPLLQTYD